jgi:hypothetical protein
VGKLTITSDPTTWTERTVVHLVAQGTLFSPQTFGTHHYYLLTIAQPGVRWSATRAAFVYRDPTIWLSPHMCQRVIGLPLLIGMPAAGLIDTNEFVERICGFIVYATVRKSRIRRRVADT